MHPKCSVLLYLFIITSFLLLVLFSFLEKAPFETHLRGIYLIKRSLQNETIFNDTNSTAEALQAPEGESMENEEKSIGSQAKPLKGQAVDQQLGQSRGQCVSVMKCEEFFVPGKGKKKSCKQVPLC